MDEDAERRICEVLSREELIDRHIKMTKEHVLTIQKLTGIGVRPKLVRQTRDHDCLSEDYVNKNIKIMTTTKEYF